MATRNQIDLALSGSTGTGTFVGSTSPTLVTPVLGTASATSLTLGTALSIANGGTGATTAAAAQTALKSCSFVARLGSTASNVTGDGTQYVVIFDTVNNNTGSAYNSATGIFTAPTTGTYCFASSISFNGLGITFTSYFIEFLVNAGDFIWSSASLATVADPGVVTGSMIFQLTAGDAVKVNLAVNGGTKTISLDGTTSSRFSGYFIG